MSETWPKVTAIVPVRNAAAFLNRLLDGLDALDYPRDRLQVLFVDGRSTDATRQMASERGWTVIDNPRQTVAPARNIGFEHATGDLIALTDADCVPRPDWLQKAARYFMASSPITLPDGRAVAPEQIACVGGPNLTPSDEGAFGRAVGFVFGQALFAAGSIHARNLPYLRAADSIPGCNAVYRREALQEVMPVDESLLTCDDTELNRRLRDLGYVLLYTPDVAVMHYRRPTPRGLWRQMRRYAIGRVQFGRRAKGNINIVHHLAGWSAPLACVAWLAFGLAFGPHGWIGWPLALALAHIVVGLWALLTTRDVAAAVLAPLAVFLTWTAWSAGFLKETFSPLKQVAGE